MRPRSLRFALQKVWKGSVSSDCIVTMKLLAPRSSSRSTHDVHFHEDRSKLAVTLFATATGTCKVMLDLEAI